MNFSGVDIGLLRFCLEHDDSGRGGEGLPPRDPADYEWLKKVLNSIATPPERMKKCISLLHNKDSVLEDRITALTELQFYAEDIDCANDLAKMGIGEVAMAMMAQPPAGASKEEEGQFVEIREMACWVVASMLQNNPLAQAQLLAQGIPHVLLAVLAQETQPRVLAKALSAVSGLIRDFPAGQRAVLQEGKDGQWLGRTLLDGRLQLRTKTVVLAKHLASAGPATAGLLVQGDFLARLLKCLAPEHENFWTDSGEVGQPNDSTLREQTLETLLALVNHALPSTSSSSSSSSSSASSDNGEYARRLKSKLSEVNLQEVVQNRVQQLGGSRQQQQAGEDGESETELSLCQVLSSALSDLEKVQV